MIAGGLTTVHQPLPEVSMRAVHNLTALIGGAPVAASRTVLSPNLMIRNSCAPPTVR